MALFRGASRSPTQLLRPAWLIVQAAVVLALGVVAVSVGCDSSSTVAADDAGTCGGWGQPCCAAGSCNPGTSCSSEGVCWVCGGPGQACCPLNRCAAGGCCVNWGGDLGNTCIAAASACPLANGDICSNGSCGGCGGLGEPCCNDFIYTPPDGGAEGGSDAQADAGVDSGSDAQADAASDSGGDAQADAASDSGSDAQAPAEAGSAPSCTSPVSRCEPSLNTCVSCGGPGEACCGGGACASPYLACNGAICLGCGGSGQPCCAFNACGTGLDCANGRVCGRCGAAGQACCIDNTCSSPTLLCSNPDGGAPLADGGLHGTGVCAGCGVRGMRCCAGAVCATGTCNTEIGYCQ